MGPYYLRAIYHNGDLLTVVLAINQYRNIEKEIIWGAAAHSHPH